MLYRLYHWHMSILLLAAACSVYTDWRHGLNITDMLTECCLCMHVVISNQVRAALAHICLSAVHTKAMRMQVISFNMGSLGFLTNHDFKSMQRDLNEVIFGSESLEQCSIDGSVHLLPNHVSCMMIAAWFMQGSSLCMQTQPDCFVLTSVLASLCMLTCWTH